MPTVDSALVFTEPAVRLKLLNGLLDRKFCTSLMPEEKADCNWPGCR